MAFPVAGSSREILPGVTLERSTLGGFSVHWNGNYIGWIHASQGNRWNAYQRSVGATFGIPLGSYLQDDAVRKIAVNAGWPGADQ